MSTPDCARCREIQDGGRQVYIVKGELGEYLFDVQQARSAVGDGRHVSQVVPDWMMERLLAVNEEHCPEHLDHVDPTVPGILGQRLGGVCLIDGNHRARRCMRDGLPFHCYILSLPESMSCLIYTEQTDFTPELMARELRGMLMNNPQIEKMDIVLDVTDDGNESECEAAVRACLTEQENARLGITCQRKGVRHEKRPTRQRDHGIEL